MRFMNQSGKRIRTARKKVNLTQAGLAEALNIDRVSVTHWESGKHAPSPLRLKAISKLLNISIDWLLTGEESSQSQEAIVITTKEKRILEIYRALPSQSQEQMLKNIEDMNELYVLRQKNH